MSHIKGEKELIWVEKDFALKYQELTKDASLNEQRLQALHDYVETIQEVSRQEFRCNLENLQEDVALYKGLMLEVKQAFEKAKNEQLEASYALWEQFDKEIPFVQEKIENITKKLAPLTNEINKLNELWGGVKTWDIEKMVEAIRAISNLSESNKEMIKFLVNNFEKNGLDIK